MKFKFKRKYTFIFTLFLFLALLAVAFYIFGPDFVSKDEKFFNQVLMVSLADIFLICFFILGSYRVNYFLYHDHIEIHRSFFKNINISYSQIEKLTEFPNDTIIFIFGTRPSFEITYTNDKNKLKKYKVRVEKHELFKLVMENENKIKISKHK